MSTSAAPDDWRPSCSLAALEARAETLAVVRAFFAARGVLEADTPTLSRGTGTDPHLDALTTEVCGERFYLQTSPEFHLKRLLAAGAPSLYRLGPSFRDEERGRRHNPEFTMLEWYRLDFSLSDLMAEVAALVDEVLGTAAYRTVTYAQLIRAQLGIGVDAAAPELAAALAAAGEQVSPDAVAADPEALLNLAFAHACGRLQGRVFVTEYPAAQAALARTEIVREHEVALRFELIVDGVEIANGYDELRDADELERRAAMDSARRAALGRDTPALDPRLLAAQRSGLPACAGVALGFDRLLMLRLGAKDIAEVMAFTMENA